MPQDTLYLRSPTKTINGVQRVEKRTGLGHPGCRLEFHQAAKVTELQCEGCILGCHIEQSLMHRACDMPGWFS